MLVQAAFATMLTDRVLRGIPAVPGFNRVFANLEPAWDEELLLTVTTCRPAHRRAVFSWGIF
jgi:hypothetical protein